MIPARYAASRFPAKLMQDLAGKPVILRTYQAAVHTKLFDEVYVVTDSDIIYETIIKEGGLAIMSKKEHDLQYLIQELKIQIPLILNIKVYMHLEKVRW